MFAWSYFVLGDSGGLVPGGTEETALRREVWYGGGDSYAYQARDNANDSWSTLQPEYGDEGIPEAVIDWVKSQT